MMMIAVGAMGRVSSIISNKTKDTTTIGSTTNITTGIVIITVMITGRESSTIIITRDRAIISGTGIMGIVIAIISISTCTIGCISNPDADKENK